MIRTQGRLWSGRMGPGATPLHVIGGYLGSGKTTLVNRLLRGADGRRVAVLVNDFGDIDIDGELIASVDDDVVSLTNGCICCSLADGLVEAFTAIRTRLDHVDVVVVEASGVADPGTIARLGRAAGLHVGPLVIVVDAASVERRSRDRYVGDTVVRQLDAADVCVVNKVDLVDAAALDRLRRWLAERAPAARVIETVRGEIGWDAFDVTSSDHRTVDHSDDPVHEHDDSHRARTFVYDTPLDRDRLMDETARLPESVVRVKGIVALTDDPDRAWALHRSGGPVELERLDAPPPATSRVVHITAGPS